MDRIRFGDEDSAAAAVKRLYAKDQYGFQMQIDMGCEVLTMNYAKYEI